MAMVFSSSRWDELRDGFFNIVLLTFLYSSFLYQFAASHHIQIYYMIHFMAVGSYCFVLKTSFAQVWGVASLCMTMAKSHTDPMAPYACASQRASCLSTLLHLHYHTRPGFLYIMSFVSPKCDKTIVAPHKDYQGLLQRLAPFVVPPLSCRIQVIPGGTKHREKGWKQLRVEFSKANAFKPFHITQTWYTWNYRSAFHNSNNTDEVKQHSMLAFN